MRRAVFFVLLMFAHMHALAAPMQLDRFVASFVLKAFGTTVGRTQWRLIPTENNQFVWESRSESAGAGVLIHDVYVTERSESEIHGDSFRPLLYRYDRHGANVSRNVEVSFDWNDSMVINTAEGHTWRMNVPAGTLDKLSYLLAMMRDLADGKRHMEYAVADGGRLKRYELRAIGSESLVTALGTLDTVKIARSRHEDDREATLWCAPVLGYLPVKLEHRDREGRLVSMHIESIEGLPPSVARKP
jgi:hypothetical protein